MRACPGVSSELRALGGLGRQEGPACVGAGLMVRVPHVGPREGFGEKAVRASISCSQPPRVLQ